MILATKMSHSTYRFFLWANNWCSNLSPNVPNTLMTPYRYQMSHQSHLFVSKWSKTVEKHVFAMFTSLTDMFYRPMSGVQLSYGITQGAYYTHDVIIVSFLSQNCYIPTLWAMMDL